MSYSDISERYRLIKPELDKFTRPFTVLDLGAFECAFSIQIAKDFPQATVIAVEQDSIAVEEAEKSGLENLLVLHRKLSTQEMILISECEQFDVALCLNFLHHCGEDWLEWRTALAQSSFRIFCQIPGPEDKQACGQDILAELNKSVSAWPILGDTIQFPGHDPRSLRLRSATGLRRVGGSTLCRSSVSSPLHSVAENAVHRDYDKKYIYLPHKKQGWQQWVYGFNLENFLALGGAYPRKERVIEMLRAMPLPEERHGDIATHNIIIDGRNAHLIDGGESWATWDDKENLEKVIQQVEERMR